MNRTLRVKRLWSMGQFNNIQFEDEVSDIPENIALNQKAIGLLYNLMVLEMEMAQKEYLRVFEKYPAFMRIFPDSVAVINETVLAIREERNRTYDEFMKEITKE